MDQGKPAQLLDAMFNDQSSVMTLLVQLQAKAVQPKREQEERDLKKLGAFQRKRSDPEFDSADYISKIEAKMTQEMLVNTTSEMPVKETKMSKKDELLALLNQPAAPQKKKRKYSDEVFDNPAYNAKIEQQTLSMI